MYRQFYEVLWLLKEWGKSAFRHYRGFTSMHHLERHTAWERHCDKWVFSLVNLGCHIQYMWFQFVDSFPKILLRFCIRVQNHFLKVYFYWNTCFSVYKTLFISSFMWTHLAFLIFACFIWSHTTYCYVRSHHTMKNGFWRVMLCHTKQKTLL